MKPNIKKLVFWLAIIMAASFGIAAIVLVVTGNFVIATEKVNESKEFDPEEINEIVIDLISTDINIIPVSEGELIVHFYGEVTTNVKKDIPELIAYKTGDKLYIETYRPKDIVIGINIWRTTIDIYIPEKDLSSMEINTVSGSIDIDDIVVDNIILKTVSGDIRADELFAEGLRIETTSGDVAVKNYKGNIDIKSISGDLNIIGGELNDTIYIVNTSGDILIEQEKSSNMDIRTISGDVKIRLSEDAQFYLDAETTSGDIKHSFPIKIISSGRRNLEGTVEDGGKRIVIGTISGDISIDYR